MRLAIFFFAAVCAVAADRESELRFTPDAGVRYLRCLNDPTLVRLSDGRYRIYVATQIVDAAGGDRPVIVSATSASKQ